MPVDNVEKASDGPSMLIEPRFFSVVRSGGHRLRFLLARRGGGTRWCGIDSAAGFSGWLSAAVSVHAPVCFSDRAGGFFAVAFRRARADFLR